MLTRAQKPGPKGYPFYLGGLSAVMAGSITSVDDRHVSIADLARPSSRRLQSQDADERDEAVDAHRAVRVGEEGRRVSDGLLPRLSCSGLRKGIYPGLSASILRQLTCADSSAVTGLTDQTR